MSIDIIDTKPKLRDHIKRKLGWPVVHLELTSEHLDDSIDDAIKLFTKQSGDATYRSALMVNMTAGETEYPLNDEVESVLSLNTQSSIGGGINTLFTIQNQMYNAGYFNVFSGSMNLTSYQMAMEYIAMTNSMLSAQYFTEFNKFTNTLHITPAPSEDMVGVLEIYSKRDFTTATSSVYDEDWIKNYSLALSKIVLGRIRSKFRGVPLPGGGELDGDTLLSEGLEEKKELEETLIIEEGAPLEPSFG